MRSPRPVHRLGATGAARRIAVASRLKRSGMFWTMRGANSIVARRCDQHSKRINAYWEERAVELAALRWHCLVRVPQRNRCGPFGIVDSFSPSRSTP